MTGTGVLTVLSSDQLTVCEETKHAADATFGCLTGAVRRENTHSRFSKLN